jgi:hypothetical protein
MKTQSISRRTIVTGSAGAVFASLAVAAAQESAGSESVRLLLDMERRYKHVLQQIEVAEEEVGRCGRLVHEAHKPCPVPPDIFLSPQASDSEWAKAEFHYQSARIRYAARCARIDEETGYSAAEEELKNLRKERDSIRMVEVWSVKAVDIQGLKVKARMAALWGNMCASTIQDLLDLAI